MTMTTRRLLFVVASLLLSGCNDVPRCNSDEECLLKTDGKPVVCNMKYRLCFLLEADGGDASVPDSGTDAGSDAGADAGRDAGTDAGVDAGFDAGIDAGRDAGADAGFDGGTDAGVDAGYDGGCPLCPTQTWTLTGVMPGNPSGDNPSGAVIAALNDGRAVVYAGDLGTGTLIFAPNGLSGTWSLGGASTAFHFDSPLAVLPSGDLLVTSGMGSGVDAEIFKADAGTWSPTAYKMSGERYFHKATTLNDGRVIFTGGRGSVGTNASEFYNPALDNFSAGPVHLVPRVFHAAVLLGDGRVLVAGGRDPSNIDLTSTEIFSATTGTWSPSGSMVGDGGFSSGVLLGNGKVLVLNASRPEIFDPASGLWVATGPMSESRVGGRLASLSDGGAIVCGNFPASKSCEQYNAATNSWQLTTPMNRARLSPLLVQLKSGKMLAVGGYRSDAGVPVDAEVFW